MTEFFKNLAVGIFLVAFMALGVLLFGGLAYYLPAWVIISFIFGALAWVFGTAFRNIL